MQHLPGAYNENHEQIKCQCGSMNIHTRGVPMPSRRVNLGIAGM